MLIQVDQRKKRQSAQDAALREEMYQEALHRMKKENRDYDHGGKQKLGYENQKKGGYVEGLGQHVADYDATQWFRARQKDKDFWRDPKNVEKYKQDNPEVRIRK